MAEFLASGNSFPDRLAVWTRPRESEDLHDVVDLLSHRPAAGAFVRANLEHWGWSSPTHETLLLCHQGQVSAVAQRYLGHVQLYSRARIEMEQSHGFLGQFREPCQTLFYDSVTRGPIPPSGWSEGRAEYLMTCRSLRASSQAPVSLEYCQSAEDLVAAAAMVAAAVEFGPPPSVQQMRAEIGAGMRRVLIARSQADPVGMGMVTGESAASGVVAAILTSPRHRGRGIATAVAHCLASDLMAEGKLPVLMQSFSATGGLYAQLGFEVVGRWFRATVEADVG